MGEIKDIKARQIYDSRGYPTIEVDVITFKNTLGRASVPAGASLGIHEALELRDGGNKLSGKEVSKCISNIENIIKNKLLGLSVFDQSYIDQTMLELDGTHNKSKLGANSILAVSLAMLEAAANEKNIPLYRYLHNNSNYIMPIPMINVINGGMHADNNLDFQEFMIMPVKANSFHEALKMSLEVFYHLKQSIKEKGLSINVGDEGGFAPNFSYNQEALDTIMHSIHKAGLNPGKDMFLAIDAASSVFYNENDNTYVINNKKLSPAEMVDFWVQLTKNYPIISIEDAMAEDDWLGWTELTKALGNKIQLVGDDLFVSNIERLTKGIKTHCGNSILLKVNQIGSFTEAKNTLEKARQNKYNTVISHRSGETESTFISDLSVAFNIGQIKAGGLSRSDRMVKYNRLIRIEEELGKNATFAKFKTFFNYDIK